MAHARLGEAKRLASGESPREFYAEVARALRGFVADKLDAAEAGLQITEIEKDLKAKQVSEEVVTEVTAILEHCDLKRFAPEGDDAEAEVLFLKRVSGVMTGLSRELKR